MAGHFTSTRLLDFNERVEYRPSPEEGVLFSRSGFELHDLIVVDDIADLDGTAADFAVLNIGLTTHGYVENHRNVFAAVWASKEVFHTL